MIVKERLKELLQSKFYWFIVGITILKVFLMGMFSSDYQDQLFIPFVDSFISDGGNPYQFAYNAGAINAFPYPIGMLLIESIGMFFIKVFNVTNAFMINLLFKMPSLVMDIIGLSILVKFFPEKRRYVAVFYYASPIILYAVYMHGQLDLIPTIFLVISLYYLVSRKNTKKRYLGGIIFSILALLCKFHILAVIPIVFFYLAKRDSIRNAIIYLMGVFSGVLIGITLFWSDGFNRIVLF